MNCEELFLDETSPENVMLLFRMTGYVFGCVCNSLLVQ